MKTLRHLKAAIAKSPHAEYLSFDVENPTSWSHEGAVYVYIAPESKFAFDGERPNNVTPFYEDEKGSRSEAIADAVDEIKERIEPMEAWLAEEHGIEL